MFQARSDSRSYFAVKKTFPSRSDQSEEILGLGLGGQPPDLLHCLGASGGPSLTSAHGDQPALCVRRSWNPPMLGKLPPDFLRLRPHQQQQHHLSGATRHGHSYTHPAGPSSTTTHHRQQLSQEMLRERMSENQRRLGDLSVTGVDSGGGSTSSSEASQMLEDEKFAIMLQNEEFMAELRGNREFLSALEEEAAAGSDSFHYHQHQQQQHQQAAAAKKGGGGGGALGMDDAAFREKLKNMGKQSKQTFSRLAHLFSRGQRGGAQRLLGHAPAPSKDNLLLSADPLVEEPRDSDESDEEKHSTTKVRCGQCRGSAP